MILLRICLYAAILFAALWYLAPNQVEGWSIIVAPLAVIFQILRKRILTVIGVFAGLSLIPMGVRMYFKHQFTFGLRTLKRIYTRMLERIISAWNSLHWGVRLAIIILPVLILASPMFIAGGTLWVVSVVSSGTAVLFASNFIRAVVLPWLAKKAAGKSMGKLAPFIWNLLPHEIRESVRQRYYALWWKTILRLMRKRRMIGRRAQELKKNWKYPIIGNPFP